MTVVDTSVWIEYLKGNREIGRVLDQMLVNREVMAVSAVFGELLQGAGNNRERTFIMGFWENLPSATETGIFLKAGNLSFEYKLFAMGVGLIDCYILAFALENDCAIWTLDKLFHKAMDLIG